MSYERYPWYERQPTFRNAQLEGHVNALVTACLQGETTTSQLQSDFSAAAGAAEVQVNNLAQFRDLTDIWDVLFQAARQIPHRHVSGQTFLLDVVSHLKDTVARTSREPLFAKFVSDSGGNPPEDWINIFCINNTPQTARQLAALPGFLRMLLPDADADAGYAGVAEGEGASLPRRRDANGDGRLNLHSFLARCYAAGWIGEEWAMYQIDGLLDVDAGYEQIGISCEWLVQGSERLLRDARWENVAGGGGGSRMTVETWKQWREKISIHARWSRGRVRTALLIEDARDSISRAEDVLGVYV